MILIWFVFAHTSFHAHGIGVAHRLNDSSHFLSTWHISIDLNYGFEDGPFSVVRKLRDNFEPRIAFQQWNRGLILEEEAGKWTYLNELDVKRPLVESISQTSEELRLYNRV